MNNLEKVFSLKIVKITFFIYLTFVVALARTFIGLNVYGFRLGEITMGIALLLLVIFLIFEIFNKTYLINKVFSFSVVSLISSFIFIKLIKEENLFNPYSFKASSYIWSIGAIFIGYMFFKNIKLNSYFVFIGYSLLTWVYYFSIYGISDQLQSYFLKYSDKFEYHKGTDILIVFIFISFLANRVESNKVRNFELFLVFSSLYLPLIVFKSRAGSFAFFIYVILEIFNNRKKYFKLNSRILTIALISIFILLQSIFFVTKSGIVEIEKIEENIQFLSEYRNPGPNENSTIEESRFLYFYNSRLYSGDGNLNWRLQIWQDVYSDLRLQKKIILGFGFKEKIPAMDDPFRSGSDGTNENVHNFIVNVFARGGFLQLFLYLIFIYSLYLYFKKRFNYLDYFILTLPILFASLFDASMENAHYPILFYILIGYLVSSSKSSV